MGLYDLSSQERNNMLSQQLIGLGAGLLQNSGYSRTPVTTGQALGSGLAGMVGARQNALAEIEARRKMEQQQLAMQRAQEMQKQLSAVPRTQQVQVPLEYQPGTGMPPYAPDATQQLDVPRSPQDVIKDQLMIAGSQDPFKAAEALKDIASLNATGQGNNHQITEVPGPDGKMHRVLVNRTDGSVVKDYGPNLESFKAKNVIGRGGSTKRPMTQDPVSGQIVYADTPMGKTEVASAEDTKIIRPPTLRGIEAAQASELSGLKNTYDRLGDVAEKAAKMPDKFGPLNGRFTQLKLKFANEGPTQGVLNELRSMITIAYGLSGKQISEQEMRMLQDAILPTMNQPYENFNATLSFAKDWVAKTHNDRIKYFEQNYFDVGSPLIGQQQNKSQATEDPLGLR